MFVGKFTSFFKERRSHGINATFPLNPFNDDSRSFIADNSFQLFQVIGVNESDAFQHWREIFLVFRLTC